MTLHACHMHVACRMHYTFYGSSLSLFSRLSLTPACQSLSSYDFMSRIIEHAMERHFSVLATPCPHPLQLQPDTVTGHGWKDLIDSLVLPQECVEMGVKSSVENAAILLLHSLLLRELPQCTSLIAEQKIATKILQWCTVLKTK